MHLIAHSQKGPNATIIRVRDLTADEITSHDNFTKPLAEARNRLCLFLILQRNFQEWRSFIDDLLNPTTKEPEATVQELNRLLLNYLTCAYTIREHFEVSFQQRFRNDQVKQDEYEAFISSLCSSFWCFAFFLDFRGYVQHRGLGIGHYSHQITQTSVQISITADANDLLAESRNWKRSHLNASHGKIDLVSHLHDFHICMQSQFASFVAKTFYPELKPASDFYAALTKEAKIKDASARMMFMEDISTPTQNGGKTSIKPVLIQAPNSVFEELGIRVA